MANVNLGFLGFGTTQSRNGTLQRPGGGLGIRTDTYAFETGSITANVAITSRSFSSEKIALVLFNDNNADGILNTGDTVRVNAGSGGTVQTINSTLSKGHYIARLTSVFDTGYNVQLARGTSNGANPLAAPEISLGTISQDLQKRGRISDNNNADNFAFTLDGTSSLNVNVRELGNKKGNVNIRVVQDLDSDGVVDSNEVVVRGVSSRNGNLDTITGLQGAGDYILQVCQSKGNTRFAASFDHVAV
ncbi:hypothetical protein IQ268_15625 [Oculatella sp. LEGE 06141]|uniref:hypothetical protein n=1 Tax=Oculatella sp. LEGE 06141 TaxID=1828648 RepID=UPI0018819349|nr:hypothetical protein [Oculatella sp. LEGE 06141]MBE9179999.1 hypothetical protein [Oculatella sp. LEGE 06141]